MTLPTPKIGSVANWFGTDRTIAPEAGKPEIFSRSAKLGGKGSPKFRQPFIEFQPVYVAHHGSFVYHPVTGAACMVHIAKVGRGYKASVSCGGDIHDHQVSKSVALLFCGEVA